MLKTETGNGLGYFENFLFYNSNVDISIVQLEMKSTKATLSNIYQRNASKMDIAMCADTLVFISSKHEICPSCFLFNP